MPLTKEEWNQLTPEEQEERIDERPEDVTPPRTGQFHVNEKGQIVDSRGVPAENVIAEANRKLKEATDKLTVEQGKREELEEKVENIQTKLMQDITNKEKNTLIENFEKAMKDLGHDDKKTVGVIIDTMKALAKQSEDSVKKEFEKNNEPTVKLTRDSLLTKAEKDDDLGIVSQYRKEIEEELDKLDPKFWTDKEVIETAIARVQRRHTKEIFEKKQEKNSEEVETYNFGPPGRRGVSPFETEVDQFMAQNNMPESQRQKARDIVEQRNKVKANLKGG